MNTHNISKHIASRLFVLMVTMLYFVPAFAQESQQPAIYNYRNDGQFNAWLDIDVEKITYSCTDLDGVEHDDIVVQEVWTPDSVYRIPISAIDSIGFRAPKPEFKEGIFHITEDHLPYAVSVENLSVILNSSIPTSLLPSVGQVVISDVFDSPFEKGFAGKVESISNVNGQIIITCSQVALNEVFKKLVLVGKGVSEDESNSKALDMRRAPRKAWTDPLVSFEGQGIYSNIELPTDLKLELLGGILEVESKKPSLTVSYCFYIDDLIYSFSADAFLNHKDLSFTIAFKLSDFQKVSQGASEYLTNFILGKGDKEKAEKEWYEHEFDNIKLKIPFNIGPVVFSIELAPVFKLEGDVELDLITKTSARQHIGFTNSGSTPFLIANPLVSLTLSDLKYGYVQDPVSVQQLTAKAEGSAAMGISLQLKAHVVSENLIKASIGAEYDREAKGTIQLNLYDTEEQPTSFYDVIKDTKVEVKDYVKIKGEIGALKFLTLDGSFKIPIKEWGSYNIVPHFTMPELPAYTNGVWTFKNPFSLYSTVSKDVLVSCKPGLRIEDVDGNLEKEYISTEPYRYEVAWELTPLEIDISDLTPDKTYKCYPTFRMLDIKTFKATPVAEFTVPQPVSLESTTITVQKDKAQNVAVNGGWGDYSVTVLDKSVCTAELKQDGDSYYIQIVGKKDGGSTSVTLKDLRSQKTAAVIVSVTNEVVQKLIKVEPTEIDFGAVPVGTSKTEHFTVSNVGTTALTFNVSEQHTEIDIPESGKEFTLAAGESKTFDVIFTPTNPNGGSGSAVRVFSDAENGTQYVTIDGQGAPADLPCAIKVEPTEIDFGTVPQGTSKTEYFTVSNIGQGELVFKIHEAGEPFFISEAGVEHTLSAGQSKQFSVTYSGAYGPGTGGQTLVTIDSNATNVEWGFGLSLKAEGGKPDDIVAYTSCPDAHHPHLIDLGLPSGTKWACCNVGAEKPEDYGGYFAWGETSEKSTYNWDTYIHCDGSYSTCHDIGKDIAGTQNDAATANWGSPWVMPNKEQMEELKNSCTSEWTTENGVNGRRFTGPNGASIFLPAAGYRWDDDLTNAGSYGDYWSSSLGESYTDYAWYLFFLYSGYVNTDSYYRNFGQSVRPVRKN